MYGALCQSHGVSRIYVILFLFSSADGDATALPARPWTPGAQGGNRRRRGLLVAGRGDADAVDVNIKSPEMPGHMNPGSPVRRYFDQLK